jgi:putative ABC transport system ATP-binding protein
MITFQNVVRNFRLDKDTVITPVDDITLTVNKGEFIIILGRSGSGKTTLLNLAAGLIKPTSGRVSVEGKDLAEMTDEQLSVMRGHRMGFVFQFPSLLPSLTVGENIRLPNIFSSGEGTHNLDERIKNVVEKLGLKGKMDCYPRQLSAGEQKRVVIARSLVNEPAIMLADEPTSDLDTRTENEVMDLLRAVNATGVTFLIVTHSLQLVPFATRAFEMQSGKLKEISMTGEGKPKIYESSRA